MPIMPSKKSKGQPFRRAGKARLEDPYMLKGVWEECTICPTCNAVFYNKRWTLDRKAREVAKKSSKSKRAKCPGCLKVEDRYAMGILYARGEFLITHKQDVVTAIKSEARRAHQKNPLEKIIDVIEEDDRIVVETTSDQLALRLGRFLNRTYSGDVKYSFSSDQKQTRVFWSRD